MYVRMCDRFTKTPPDGRMQALLDAHRQRILKECDGMWIAPTVPPSGLMLKDCRCDGHMYHVSASMLLTRAAVDIIYNICDNLSAVHDQYVSMCAFDSRTQLIHSLDALSQPFALYLEGALF